MTKKTKLILIVSLIFLVLIFLFWLFFSRSKDNIFLKQVFIGKIESLSENSIVLDINYLDSERDNNFDLVNFTINKNTSIFIDSKQIKSKEEFSQEYEAFKQKVKALKEKDINIIGLEAPSWNKYVKTNPESLKKGQIIKIYLYSNKEYIKGILADKIIITSTTEGNNNIGIEDSGEDLESIYFGKVVSFNNNILNLAPVGSDPASTSTPENINITINADTKILKTETKIQAEFDKDYKDFLSQNSNVAPSWTKDSLVDRSSIAAGENVEVFLDPKLSTADYLVAKSIKIILEQPDKDVDSDNDGLIDLDEVDIYKTDPNNPDTDGDGYLDGDEVKNGYNPNGVGKL